MYTKLGKDFNDEQLYAFQSMLECSLVDEGGIHIPFALNYISKDVRFQALSETEQLEVLEAFTDDRSERLKVLKK